MDLGTLVANKVKEDDRDSLRAELSAARAEIELRDKVIDKLDDEYEAKLAARDLVIKQMQTALQLTKAHVIATHVATDGRYQRDIDDVDKALALQPSQEHLDAYVDGKVAAEREECAKVCESLFASKQLCNSSAAAIRARKD